MAVKVIVYWKTKDKAKIELIRNRFGFPRYTTLNGYTPGKIAESDMEVFEETARRGFIRYRRIEWTLQNGVYSW